MAVEGEADLLDQPLFGKSRQCPPGNKLFATYILMADEWIGPRSIGLFGGQLAVSLDLVAVVLGAACGVAAAIAAAATSPRAHPPTSTSWLYDAMLSPFYERLVCMWPRAVHPNVITCIGGFWCGVSVLAMRNGCWGYACASYTAYHMCDNMDGKHARRTGQTSRLGHVLDHAIDGSLGVIATCTTCVSAIFDFSETLPFALSCGMCGFLACHAAEYASGVASLGTRYFSVDELFLACSIALGWRAWSDHSLVPCPRSAFCYVRFCWVGCGAYTTTTLLARYPKWLAAIGGFGIVCALSPWPWPVAVYLPLAAALLWLNASGHTQAGIASSQPALKKRLS